MSKERFIVEMPVVGVAAYTVDAEDRADAVTKLLLHAEEYEPELSYEFDILAPSDERIKARRLNHVGFVGGSGNGV
jgi:hypothetical protein